METKGMMPYVKPYVARLFLDMQYEHRKYFLVIWCSMYLQVSHLKNCTAADLSTSQDQHERYNINLYVLCY